MSKYEKTRILGQRAKQLNSGNKPFIAVPKKCFGWLSNCSRRTKTKKTTIYY